MWLESAFRHRALGAEANHHLAHDVASRHPPHRSQILEQPLLVRRKANGNGFGEGRGDQMAISPRLVKTLRPPQSRTLPVSARGRPSPSPQR